VSTRAPGQWENPRIKTVASALCVAGALACAPAASAAPLLFNFTPTQPLTGEVVTFTAATGGTITWDLDGDDVCDDASGAVAARSFPSAGTYTVKLCVNGDQIEEKATLPVSNRPPTASFSFLPTNPVTKERVDFTSTSLDPDGPIVAQEWDLNGDGVFGDKTGETMAAFWLRAGTYPVALRVTDRDGATAVSQQSVVITKRPPGVLTPAPFVRMVGVPTATGARLSLLTITAPPGAHVGVRCKGGNCPYSRKRFTSKGKRVTLRKLSRNFGAGTVIELRVTKPETIGTVTRIRIRAGQRPARLDRCLRPGRPNKLIACS
jgi:PKD domain